MNPYGEEPIEALVRAFLEKFFDDARQRTLVFGINPGRFGAGITGITFTDPVALAEDCGIPNHLAPRRELSSIFIYDAIRRLGGVRAFYAHFFLTAVSPLGFTRDGRNLNYYDDPRLTRAVTPFIERSVEEQIALGARRDHAVVIGRGQNRAFFERLNEVHGWFAAIHTLDHPRAIMQYHRKELGAYLRRYEETLRPLMNGSSPVVPIRSRSDERAPRTPRPRPRSGAREMRCEASSAGRLRLVERGMIGTLSLSGCGLRRFRSASRAHVGSQRDPHHQTWERFWLDKNRIPAHQPTPFHRRRRSMQGHTLTRAALVLVAPFAIQACATKGFVRNQLSSERARADSTLSAQIATERNDRVSGDSVNAARITAVRAAIDSLRTDFGAKIAMVEDGIRFAMPVTFAFDDATVRDEDKPMLQRFANVAQKYYPGSAITVEGFADPAGSVRYNLDLSRRRADAVKGALTQLGMQGDIKVVGYGKTRLVTPGAAKDAPGAEKNRRVVFVVESGSADSTSVKAVSER